jgi:hypothetical protein
MDPSNVSCPLVCCEQRFTTILLRHSGSGVQVACTLRISTLIVAAKDILPFISRHSSSSSQLSSFIIIVTMQFCSFAVLAAFAASGSYAQSTDSMKKCSFRPLDQTPPIELTLPKSAIASRKDLPIEFHGLHPLVLRKDIPYGQKPKVTVFRYSGNAPEIEFDEITETVTIKSSSCSGGPFGDSETAAGASCRNTNAGLLSTLVITAAAALNENTRPLAALLAAGAAGGGWMGAHAQQDNAQCMPVVQVVVEAPAAYRGAVETCLQEINNPDICPDFFPKYPTCADPEPQCKIAVVGAGTGGLYAALRMVDEGLVEASDICIFEQTERVGGRIVSLRGLGPDGDLVIDAGGYRTVSRSIGV